MSQESEILKMLDKGPVTAMDALEKCACFRLAARIKGLREKGHDIWTETVSENGKQYARYHLIKKKQPEAA